MGDDEPPENALKRFRWATKTSGLVQEVRIRCGCCCSFSCRNSSFSNRVKLDITLSISMPTLQARRRRYFENTQDEKKRRIKDGHMKKSK